MKKFNQSILVAIASAMFMCSTALASDENFIFTYDYEGARHELFGIQRNVQIDAAMLLKNPSLTGFEILGVSVDIPTKNGCECAPVASAWLTKELRVDGESNLPDLMEAKGEIRNYGTDSEPELRLDITFSEPYTLTDDGVYIGYSLSVISCNVPGSGWTAKYPIVTVCDIDKPECFMIHCTKGSSTLPQKYPEWVDLGKDLHQALAMRVIMRGKYQDNAASLEPLQTLYAEPATTGHVFTNLNNHGTTEINSIDYSYTIESEGETRQTFSQKLELDTPVHGQLGAYVTLDIPFKVPDVTGEYSVALRVDKVNGQPNVYEGSSVLDMVVVPFLPKHRPIVEDYTALWCRYCPAVYVAVKQMHDKYGEEFLSLALHSDDELQSVKAENMPSPSYGTPMAFMEDRGECIDYSNLEYLWVRQRRKLAPADINVNIYWMDAAHTALRAESTVKFVYDNPEANYMLAYALVEDGMSDKAWSQTNDYSDCDFEGPYWDLFCGKGFIVKGLIYDDIVVSFPSNKGIDASLPSSITGSTEYSHSSVLSLDEAVCQHGTNIKYGKNIIKNPDSLRVVALLIDGNTGNVCNAASSGYSKDADVYAQSGIGSTEYGISDIDVKYTEYFTIDGVKHDHMPERGVIIIVKHLGDGSVSTEKRIL
ncbi:MAG: hypothetical protein K2K00_05015 [Muribaculaceae bacterium]|nr:hypothetical protein [Muribaculaceae bacterium]MDE5595280.1 hypothetical protein [Muribaculaceae bacterium]MDE6703020.1 hypothetical protein [Muribaculaceae bacterium]